MTYLSFTETNEFHNRENISSNGTSIRPKIGALIPEELKKKTLPWRIQNKRMAIIQKANARSPYV
jgi:hypothetical protein